MTLISEQQLPSIVKRLAHQILETYPGLTNAVIVGLQPRGVYLSDRIVAALHQELPADKVQYGKLDITFIETMLDEIYIWQRPPTYPSVLRAKP